VAVWDSHTIRPTRNRRVPGGRPVVMYSVPEIYGTRDYRVNVQSDEIAACKSECVYAASVCDPLVEEICIVLMNEHDWSLPVDYIEAVTLYHNLRGALPNDVVET